MQAGVLLQSFEGKIFPQDSRDSEMLWFYLNLGLLSPKDSQ